MPSPRGLGMGPNTARTVVEKAATKQSISGSFKFVVSIRSD